VADKIDKETAWKTPFGKGVLSLGIGMDDDARKRLRTAARRSPTFLSLLNQSANKYEYQQHAVLRTNEIIREGEIPKKTAPLIIDDGGWLRSSDGKSTSKRIIVFYPGFSDAGHFSPHPDPNARSDGDTIALDQDKLFMRDEELRKFIGVAAHEMQHALNHYKKATATKPQKRNFLEAAKDFLDNEADSRITEKIVLRELKDPRGFKTLRDAPSVADQIKFVNEGVEPRDIARSMVSGRYTTTYAEAFTLDYRKSAQMTPRRPDPDQVRDIWTDVDKLLDRPDNPDTPGDPGFTLAIERISDPLRPVQDYAEALAVYVTFGAAIGRNRHMEFALLHLIERIISHRWKKFLEVYEGHPEYFLELEKRAKEHAALLLGPIEGATFEGLYGEPTQTSALTLK
jgi:hypothetical protein